MWIAICAALFIWELTVIDQDRADQDKVHSADVAAQTARFAIIAETWADVIKQQQKDFAQTMKVMEDSQKEDRQEFDGVLGKEQKLYEREEVTQHLAKGRRFHGRGSKESEIDEAPEGHDNRRSNPSCLPP